MQVVVHAMQNGPFSYAFQDRREQHRQHLLPHEAHPLGILRIVNRGRARATNNQIRLVPHPPMNNTTLQDMVAGTGQVANRFLVPEISFEDKRLVFFFSKLTIYRLGIFLIKYSLSFTTAVLGRRLTAHMSRLEGEPPRLHTCIPDYIWNKFPNDRYDNSEAGDFVSSGGESDVDGGTGSDADDEVTVVNVITPQQNNVRSLTLFLCTNSIALI